MRVGGQMWVRGVWVYGRVLGAGEGVGRYACMHARLCGRTHHSHISYTTHTVFSANQFACISLHHLSAYFQSD